MTSLKTTYKGRNVWQEHHMVVSGYMCSYVCYILHNEYVRLQILDPFHGFCEQLSRAKVQHGK